MPTCLDLNLTCTLLLNGVAASEYGNTYERENRFSSCYVEAKTEQPFSIRVQPLSFIAPLLLVCVFIDGVFQDGVYSPNMREEDVVYGFPHVDLDGKVDFELVDDRVVAAIQRWRFQELEISDEGQQMPRGFLEKLGNIEVVVCRCRSLPAPGDRSHSRTPPPPQCVERGNPRAKEYWRYDNDSTPEMPLERVDERSMKGSQISHSLGLGEKSVIPYSTFVAEQMEALKKPYAIFTFQYRTRGNLVGMGLVEDVGGGGSRELKDMSKEELIWELRRVTQQQQQQEQLVKREGWAWQFQQGETVDLSED